MRTCASTCACMRAQVRARACARPHATTTVLLVPAGWVATVVAWSMGLLLVLELTLALALSVTSVLVVMLMLMLKPELVAALVLELTWAVRAFVSISTSSAFFGCPVMDGCV